MKRSALVDVAVVWGVASIIVLYLALAQPAIRDQAVHVYILIVGGLTMLAILGATNDALPRRDRSPLTRALDERGSRDRPLPELAKLEREVTLATTSAYDLHFRLVPHLREIASCRLERRGQALGPETAGRWWPLLRPDREPPEERFSGGIAEAELRALVEELERI